MVSSTGIIQMTWQTGRTCAPDACVVSLAYATRLLPSFTGEFEGAEKTVDVQSDNRPDAYFTHLCGVPTGDGP